MDHIVDARGLSCPQPVILTMKKIKETNSNEITVLVDTDTSKENVIRAALFKGWKGEKVQEVDDGYEIILRKDK